MATKKPKPKQPIMTIEELGQALGLAMGAVHKLSQNVPVRGDDIALLDALEAHFDQLGTPLDLYLARRIESLRVRLNARAAP